MRNLRAIHRAVTAIIVVFTLYLSLTGTLIQMIDLRTLFTQAPATDPNTQSMREGFNGTPAFQVIATPDYTASALGSNANASDMLATVLESARATAGSAPLRYIELRVLDGKPVGQVDTGAATLLRFDALSGAFLGKFPPVHENASPDSERNTVKHLHRMTAFGDWALWINVVVGLGLAVLIVTGAWMYLTLFRTRLRFNRSNPFWSAGGWWRTLHRSISILAAVFLSVVMVSGFWLAYESLGKALYMAKHPVKPGSVANSADVSTPLTDGALPPMLRTILSAYEAAVPGVPARVIRLRYFAGMPQGVVISGEEEARQLVFNAATGQRASLTEPGYPPTGFPFGWQAHQLAKNIHRGGIFGLTGRMMDLFAGLSMIYLSVSGIVLYYQMWSRRRRAGRPGFFWA